MRKRKRGSPPVKSIFRPRHPEKYIGSKGRKPGGEYGLIVARSGWERQVMKFLDENPNVLLWNSEGLVVPYVHPVTGRFHRYHADFVAKIRTEEGTAQILVIEIKPAKEAKREPRTARDRIIRAINEAKWSAAAAYCSQRAMRFIVLTEEEIAFTR